MTDIPISVLLSLLALLITLSAFFSGSETALMSINRYRLRHKAKAGFRGAILVSKLLERPDRLIGLILLGNNAVNILAASLSTVIALRLIQDADLALAASTIVLTLLILIFAEVAPKTLAAFHPEWLAYPAAYIYTPLLKIFYPLVWLVNNAANSVLTIFRLKPNPTESDDHHLSRDELQTVVNEAGALIPKKHQKMLLNILDLETVTVEDIMVPRNEVVGIDLDEDWDSILEQLNHISHTRLPVYRESIDNAIGILHLKKILRMMIAEENFSVETIESVIVEPYFIPEGTPLTKQLLNFQKEKRRIGLVVDEYGDLQGLVTLEDILEEIVGEFTTDPTANIRDIHPQTDGSYLVDGSIHIRELNKALTLSLPTNGPKTLNGVILEHMEMIPDAGTSLLLHTHPIEIVKTQNNAVKTVRICLTSQLNKNNA